MLTLGASSEYSFTRTPLSAFVSYTHQRLNGGLPEALNVDRVLVGFKFNLDGRSLWDSETGGASLDPITSGFDQSSFFAEQWLMGRAS